MIRIALIIDSRLLRDMLADRLRSCKFLKVVGSMTTNGARNQISKCFNADVLIVDGSSPHISSLVRETVAFQNKIHVVSLCTTDANIIELAGIGVEAFVSQEQGFQGLLEVLRGVMDGDPFCSPNIAAALRRQVYRLANQNKSTAQRRGILTEREDQIAKLIDLGLANKQIANRLQISCSTVKNHIHNILVKLGVQRRGQVAPYLRQVSQSHSDDGYSARTQM